MNEKVIVRRKNNFCEENHGKNVDWKKNDNWTKKLKKDLKKVTERNKERKQIENKKIIGIIMEEFKDWKKRNWMGKE